MVRFENRMEAGRQLARRLREWPGLGVDPLVLGLVRGGAEVAASLAAELSAWWDVFIVRKIGAPQQPEYALGALAETGHYLLNQPVLDQLELGRPWVDSALSQAQAQCRRLAAELRGTEQPPQFAGRHVLLTDDGVATGFTMHAAVNAVSAGGAASVLVAVPVIAPDTLAEFQEAGITCCCLAAPRGFRAVGQYYRDFSEVATADVRQLLAGRGVA